MLSFRKNGHYHWFEWKLCGDLLFASECCWDFHRYLKTLLQPNKRTFAKCICQRTNYLNTCVWSMWFILTWWHLFWPKFWMTKENRLCEPTKALTCCEHTKWCPFRFHFKVEMSKYNSKHLNFVRMGTITRTSGFVSSNLRLKTLDSSNILKYGHGKPAKPLVPVLVP